MALKLGELSAVISADDKPFEKGLEESEGKFKKFGDKLQAAGALIGAAAGAALAVGLASAMELDAANDKLAAQLGLSAEESKRMGGIAGDLYANAYGESLGQVNDAIKAVTRNLGDLTDDELKDVTASALNLASAFDVDVNEAARATAKLLKTGLAPDATAALDLITRGFQTGTDEAGDLLDTISEYSTKFRDLGLDGQTALGLLSQGLAAGARDADTVADALKEFSIRAIDGSKATGEGFKALGLNGKKMADDIAAGGPRAATALDTVLDRLRGIKDPAERNAAAVALFGTKAEDLGDALFALDPTNAVQALGDVDGAAKKMGDTLSDNASTKIEEFKRKAQQAFVEKLAEALPYIEKTLGWLKDNSDWVTPLVIGLGVLAGAIWLISTAMSVWAVVQTILNLALWSSPITWIVLAVIVLVAIIVLIATKTTWFQDAWNAAWGGIKDAASAVGSWFVDTLWGKWIKGAWDGITGAGEKAVGWFNSLPGKIKSALGGIADFVSAPFKAGFNAVARFWNNGPGQLSFTAPNWIPGFGGKGFSLPKLPYLAQGGVVPATPGGRLVVAGEAGEDEIVQPRSQVRAMLREAIAAGVQMAAGRGDNQPSGDVIVIVDGEVIERRSLAAVRRNPEDVALAARAGDKSLEFAN